VLGLAPLDPTYLLTAGETELLLHGLGRCRELAQQVLGGLRGGALDDQAQHVHLLFPHPCFRFLDLPFGWSGAVGVMVGVGSIGVG
ncbi:MAG TPA: hypothetical protein VG845_13965, partial [Dehalococcoidia bacterium]|nr:hypothetical protein [Dehalococcoidia bacterium]